MNKIGLIAGSGELPRIWAREAAKNGCQVFAFPLRQEDTLPLEDLVIDISPVDIGNLNDLLQKLREKEIRRIVMLGKVKKTHLFRNLQPDFRLKRLLSELDVYSDENILRVLATEFASDGIKVLKQSVFLDKLLAPAGLLTSVSPPAALEEEMKFTFNVAREIGRLDIGQTVLAKNGAILAVEAIEGTDRAIKRAGRMGGSGATMAKVSRPGQDLRFDIPTVGLTTIKNLACIGAQALILEAGKTFIINKKEVIQKAENAGIIITAME